MPTYPGGKNGAGVYQRIINLMPPHEIYIEPFLGGAAVMRLKRPAALNIGLDLDPATLKRTMADPLVARNGDKRSRRAPSPDPVGGAETPRFQFLHQDALCFLRSYHFTGRELVYCDPPYLLSTRSGKKLYTHEMSEAQHLELVSLVRTIKAPIMISGYFSPLYRDALKGWNSIHFQAMTRGGRMATEWLWCNFPPPVALHDYRYLGENFRERERIKRKKLRWTARLERMPLLERQALLCAIGETWAPAVSSKRPRSTFTFYEQPARPELEPREALPVLSDPPEPIR